MKINAGKAAKAVLDVIYPRRCVFCGQVLYFMQEGDICDECGADIRRINYEEDGCMALYEYGGKIREALFRLKYDNVKSLGGVFGGLMYEYFKEKGKALDFDCITAVPISPERLKTRGYNQTELMARELSRLSGIPYNDGIVRIKETAPQNSLTIEERMNNIKGAFSANSDFKGMRVLILDDINTTGSTLRECRKVLYEAGAVEVKGLCVAKTVLKSGSTEPQRI